MEIYLFFSGIFAMAGAFLGFAFYIYIKEMR